MYHVTTNNRLKQIMAQGLEPGHHRRWKNSWGARLGDRGFIYLISEFPRAVQFAAKQDYEHRASGKKVKSIILALRNVPSEGLVHDDHIEGQLAGHTWYKSPATIPPQDIVQVIDLTPEMIKQLVRSNNSQPDTETADAVPDPTARMA
jgi:hypothetical protein